MIAPLRADSDRPRSAQSPEAFEAMLPTIRRVAAYAFRHAPRELREELVADVVAQAFLAFMNLVARGKAAWAYPTVLAKYAIWQMRDGRQAGCRQNVRDVLSPLAQRRQGFCVQPLDDCQAHDDWQALTDGWRATPAEIAALRMDFRAWLSRLQPFQRQVALQLAAGHTTAQVARCWRVSAARVSQLRQELRHNWNQFQTVRVPA